MDSKGEYKSLEQLKRDLQKFLCDCRPDMHEPDEQGIKAHVVGDHLDNACGERITGDAVARRYQEYVVVLHHEFPPFDYFKINLATLIALAREE